MASSGAKQKHTCDLCGAAIPIEDVVSRIAEAPFGLVCSECRDHNFQQHRLRVESIKTGFSGEETLLVPPPPSARAPAPEPAPALPAPKPAPAASSAGSWVNPAGGPRRSNRVRIRIRGGQYYLDFGMSRDEHASADPVLHFSTIELSRPLARKLAEHLLRILWAEEDKPLPELPRIAA